MTRRFLSACLLLSVAVSAGCTPAGSTGTASAGPASAAGGSPAPASAGASSAGSASAAPSAGSGGGTGSADDACDLVTAEEVSGIVGETVTAQPPAGTFGANSVSLCTFSGASGALVLTVGQGDVGANTSGFGAAAGAGAVPVPGLGDEAFYLASGGTIYVRQGTTYVVSALQFASITGDAVKSGLEQIVRTALGRL